MCKRYIDAYALEYRVEDFEKLTGMKLDIVHDFVSSQPTADARENVRGEWIDEPVYKQTMDGKTWGGFTYCSECKGMHEYGYRSKYCPNCGAEMRKEEQK